MIKLLKKYAQEEQGATAIEYGMIVAGISVAIMVTMALIGGDINAMFVTLQTFI